MRGILIILLLLAVNLCYGQGKYNAIYTWTRDNEDNDIRSSVTHFNNYGKKIDIQYRHAGLLHATTSYEYLADTFISRTRTTFDTGDSTITTYTYSNNTIAEAYELQYYFDSISNNRIQLTDTIIENYIYDIKGRFTECTRRIKKSQFADPRPKNEHEYHHANYILYTYDSLGRIITENRKLIYRLNDRDFEAGLKYRNKLPKDTVQSTVINYIYYHTGYSKIIIDSIYRVYDTTTVTYAFDRRKRIKIETEDNKK
jgi:hypothetical protein